MCISSANKGNKNKWCLASFDEQIVGAEPVGWIERAREGLAVISSLTESGKRRQVEHFGQTRSVRD